MHTMCFVYALQWLYVADELVASLGAVYLEGVGQREGTLIS